MLRSKLRKGGEERAWRFIKEYLNDLWGADDLRKGEAGDGGPGSSQLFFENDKNQDLSGTSKRFTFTSTVVMRLSEALEDACPSLKPSWNVLALSGATCAESRPEVLAGLTVFAGLGGAQSLEQLMQLARIVHAGVRTGEEDVVVKAVEGLSETFDSDTKGSLVVKPTGIGGGGAGSGEEQILQVRPFWDLALGIAVALLTSGSERLYRSAARLALRLLRLTHMQRPAQRISPSQGRSVEEDDEHLTLGPQDTRLVVMFGICPVVSVPPDVMLAIIVERGLFSLFGTSCTPSPSPATTPGRRTDRGLWPALGVDSRSPLGSLTESLF